MRLQEVRQNLFFILLFFFLLILSLYFFDRWKNDNTESRLIFVKALVENGILNVDAYHDRTIDIAYFNGHYYSEKPPLPALLTSSVYLLLTSCHLISFNDHTILSIGNIITGSLPFTLIVFITFLSLHRKSKSELPQQDSSKITSMNISFALLPFFGSFIFVYSGTFFAHLLTSFFILTFYYANDDFIFWPELLQEWLYCVSMQ